MYYEMVNTLIESVCYYLLTTGCSGARFISDIAFDLPYKRPLTVCVLDGQLNRKPRTVKIEPRL